METAPTDGTEIIGVVCYAPDPSPTITRFHEGAWECADWDDETGRYQRAYWLPTHWTEVPVWHD